MTVALTRLVPSWMAENGGNQSSTGHSRRRVRIAIDWLQFAKIFRPLYAWRNDVLPDGILNQVGIRCYP